MYRMHIDDISMSMACDTKRKGASHVEYICQWLKENDALIVRPDPVRIANNFMPGTFTMRSGRWGEDEALPPFDRHRQMLEDAQNNPPEPR
jgi:hypothetical protein